MVEVEVEQSTDELDLVAARLARLAVNFGSNLAWAQLSLAAPAGGTSPAP